MDGEYEGLTSQDWSLGWQINSLLPPSYTRSLAALQIALQNVEERALHGGYDDVTPVGCNGTQSSVIKLG